MDQLININNTSAGEPTKVLTLDGGAKLAEPIYSIYLSGKITGDSNYLNKFGTVAHELRVMYPKATIFNPAKEFLEISEMLRKAGVDEEKEHEILLAMCLKILDEYQAIALIPGWTESKGAIIEFQAAVKKGMAILILSQDWWMP